MKNIVIFDFDGTIMRSVAQSIDVFCQLLARTGAEVTHELRRTLALKWGMHFSEYRPQLFPQISEAATYAMFEAMRPLVEIAPFERTAETLARLRSKGVDLYLFTSRPRTHTRELLGQFDLMRYFTRVLCVEDVGWENAKPSAHGIDLIMDPLEAVGRSRDEAVLVGDGYFADRLCAANAGVDLIAVSQEGLVDRETWLEAGVPPENILSSIRDVPDRLGRL